LSLGVEERFAQGSGPELERTLVRLLGSRRHEAYLDIGGGTGALASLMSPKFSSVVVLEPSQRKASYGAKRGRSGFVRGVAEALPFTDESFDMISAVASFHHMTDQDRALAEMSRLMRRGGILAVVEIDIGTTRGKVLRFLETRIMRHNLHFPSREELERLVSSHSFRPVSWESLRRGSLLAAEKQ